MAGCSGREVGIWGRASASQGLPIVSCLQEPGKAVISPRKPTQGFWMIGTPPQLCTMHRHHHLCPA